MKSKLLLTFLSLFYLSLSYGQNSLSVPNIEAGIGEKTKVLIQLSNSDDITGFQFTLNVSDPNLIIKEKEATLTSRKDDHILSVKKINSTQYLFLGVSLSNQVIKDKAGTLIEIPMEVPVSYQVGQKYTLRLTDVILSSPKAENIGSAHKDGVLTIVEGKTPDLTISAIKVSESKIVPGGKISVTWSVDNIGSLSAAGGWTEQISLISQTTGVNYFLGQVTYNQPLEFQKSVSRNATFDIPKIIKLDGNVKVEINIVPNPSVKEPDQSKANNTVLSTETTFLEKLLYLTFSRNSIEENSTEAIRTTLTRSGDITKEGTFQLTGSKSGQLDFPQSISIAKDQSSVVAYIKPINNNIADGNRSVTLSFSGVDYPTVSDSIEIIDDEASSITLTPSKTTATDGETVIVTLQTDLAKAKDIRFSITATEVSRWNVPSEVILPANSTSITFPVTVKNTQRPEPLVTGEIRAMADGFKAGKAEVALKSSNIPSFEFEIKPDTISEGDGINATYAIIKRLDKPEIAVKIKLTENVPNSLIFNSIIDFPANTNELKFKIGAVDNDVVDGERKVTLTASILLASCGCTGEAGKSGSVLSKTITILDNDGPGLKVLANPATVKAGKENSSKITIQRNTTNVSNAVTINLSSSEPSIITIPQTVVVPAGQGSVDVSISTKINPAKKGDQTVRIQAAAEGFNSGFGWILVSDQNKPDAVAKTVTTPMEATGNGVIEVVINIQNQGFSNLSKNTKVAYYLSKDKTVTGATLLSTVSLDSDILPDQSVNFKQTLKLPETAGNYYIVVVLNPDRTIDELTLDNNTGNNPICLISNYTATSSVSKAVFMVGETITISGKATMSDSNPAVNKEVEIIIRNGDFERPFSIKTNSSGNYVYDFQPLAGEGGHYDVTAGYPGVKGATQASFDILAFEMMDKEAIRWEVTEGQTFEREMKLKNNTKITLTNIRINLPENADFKIQASPLTLGAGQEGILKYTITPNKASVERKYAEIKANITSGEGAKLDFIALYYCHSQTAKLVANPVSINTTMIKGSSRYYEFSVVNEGAIAAKNVKIELPSMDWMILRSPQVIESIHPSDTAKIILELKPTEKQILNQPLSGTLVVNPSNGPGLSIPFKIETVSTSTGSLKIDVVDEYTYFTEKAPHLKGAKVIVRHPYSGNIIADGITDENGLFLVNDMPEGRYVVTVTANKHGDYQRILSIDPATTTEEKVFLPYQAISYEWDVKRTEIEDKYEMELIVKFETNVPAPVVVFEFDKTPVQLQPGESRILNVAVTNHGLINAVDVSLSASALEGYTFEFLVNEIPVLNAKSSVIVPFLMKRNKSALRSTVSCPNPIIMGLFRILCLEELDKRFFGDQNPIEFEKGGWCNPEGPAQNIKFPDVFSGPGTNDPAPRPAKPTDPYREWRERFCKGLGDIIGGGGASARSANADENNNSVTELRSAKSDEVCATVTVKFPQTMVMAREAFEGTLSINNGSTAGAMRDIKLDFVVTDENGSDETHLFQINKNGSLIGLSDIDGSGSIPSNGTGSATVLFIPTKFAAPTVPKSYSFGGILYYTDPDTGEKVARKLLPVTLEVNPSPDLSLHYFMQRDILGDDALTEDIVEPIIPAEMSLMIKNEGYGMAKNVMVESVKPEIIENEKGLLIDFDIVGCNFNNEPKQLGLMNVNFGNIDPKKSAIGQWWFTSTLLGHFIEYQVNVTHLNSYGNKNLSLIKDYQVHELIRSVKAYGAGQDSIADFLVNDQADANDIPDAIYYSNGDSDPVDLSEESSVSNMISSANLTSTLTMKPHLMGWNYGNLNDPGSNKYKLIKVVRKSDSREMPAQNFWQTAVTLRDGKKPLYENKLHFVDKISATEQYTLYYTSVGKDVPEVISFERVPDKFSTTPVEYVQVNFNKPVDVNSFGTNALSLIYQGVGVSTDNILIGKITDSSYLLTIKPLTTASGYYELTVHCDKVKDTLGIEGINGKKIGWTQIIGELGINTFTKKQVKSMPVTEIEILFNKQVELAQLSKDKFTINGKPLANITIAAKDENKMAYIITGLTEYNSGSGEYEFSVNMPEIEATDHIKGLIIQSYKWKVSIDMPEIKHFTPQYQGAVNPQNVTDMLVSINKPIVEFKPEWVSLSKGSVNQDLKARISKQDSLHYLISGLGEYTYTEGGYKLTVNQSKFTDEFGNNGVATVDTTWIVTLGKPLAPNNMRITPDRGVSDKDNITSGDDLSISLATSGNKQTVKLYVVSPIGRTLINETYVPTPGVLTIPLVPAENYLGKNTFEAIVIDSLGNESPKASIETYVDAVSLTGTITVNDNCGEVDKVSITFSEDINAAGFNKDAVVIKSAGIKLSTKEIVINRISNKSFEITNFTGINDNGDKSIEIDQSKLHKNLSGLPGVGISSINMGSTSLGSLVINGQDSATVKQEKRYLIDQTYETVDPQWTVTGGLVTKSDDQSVSVVWNEAGRQKVTLNYKTVKGCPKTSIKMIDVVSEVITGIDPVATSKESLTIAPIPNNGSFTIFMENIPQGTYSLDIFDISGKKVYMLPDMNISGSYIRKMDTGLSVKGFYYLIIHNENRQYKVKFRID